MFKVDEKTLTDSSKSIEALSTLLSMAHNGAKLKPSQVGKALKDAMIAKTRLDKFIKP